MILVSPFTDEAIKPQSEYYQINLKICIESNQSIKEFLRIGIGIIYSFLCFIITKLIITRLLKSRLKLSILDFGI